MVNNVAFFASHNFIATTMTHSIHYVFMILFIRHVLMNAKNFLCWKFLCVSLINILWWIFAYSDFILCSIMKRYRFWTESERKGIRNILINLWMVSRSHCFLEGLYVFKRSGRFSLRIRNFIRGHWLDVWIWRFGHCAINFFQMRNNSNLLSFGNPSFIFCDSHLFKDIF